MTRQSERQIMTDLRLFYSIIDSRNGTLYDYLREEKMDIGNEVEIVRLPDPYGYDPHKFVLVNGYLPAFEQYEQKKFKFIATLTTPEKLGYTDEDISRAVEKSFETLVIAAFDEYSETFRELLKAQKNKYSINESH